ncbi:lactoylglutathione lyase-like [Penaeus japonicus]|uniref:lactoylglutathione lyase-like n=1 Tax=Penaeus japonicus TaxID=27405 RepID=UPI001C712E80|nr:lactoylglutathione lyase-like [Penaeus japonicus]
MNTKVLLLLGLAALAAADTPRYAYSAPRRSFEDSVESGEAKYNFNWAVDHDDSGNDFGHQEARDDDNTQGSYYVQLPDGRLQTVKYFVDGDSGYVAEVNYEGEARYDSVESRETFRPRPSYSAPSPRFDSLESRERSAPAPFRTRHFDSRESLEIPGRFFDSRESLETNRRPFNSRESLEDIRRQYGF